MAPKTISDFRLSTARKLRETATEPERLLWKALKRIPMEGSHFRRQAPIGRYFADFLCPAARLIVELDGEQHGFEANRQHDEIRTLWLEGEGYRVLRFWNGEVRDNLDGVIETIYAALYGGLNQPARPFRSGD